MLKKKKKSWLCSPNKVPDLRMILKNIYFYIINPIEAWFLKSRFIFIFRVVNHDFLFFCAKNIEVSESPTMFEEEPSLHW